MASSSSSTAREMMLTLKTGDNEEFYLEESLLLQSDLIKTMVKEEHVSSIPLPSIKSKTLVKIIEYFKKHAELITASNKEDFKNFEKEFVNVALEELLDISVAVNYMKINNLLDLCCQAVADRIKDKSVEAIQKIFKIESDFTQEEVAEFKRETPWAFEGDLDNTTN